MSAPGRLGSTEQIGTGRSRWDGKAATRQRWRQLTIASLTFVAKPDTWLKVGLVADNVSSLSASGRQQPLPSGPSIAASQFETG